jgi:hypothetical protein
VVAKRTGLGGQALFVLLNNYVLKGKHPGRGIL